MTGVDPRGCGGAADTSGHSSSSLGRSPRVRGSPLARAGDWNTRGSIPAGAGEPFGVSAFLVAMGVDPRGCGGAGLPPGTRLPWRGRSPRVRGSRASCNGLRQRRGSIPAGAGEPRILIVSRRSARVDPRGCGGALGDIHSAAQATGRSPRVRGSRAGARQKRGLPGSIPAGAGEPRSVIGNLRLCQVDPRGCGGANSSFCPAMIIRGRSPRVRGSR